MIVITYLEVREEWPCVDTTGDRPVALPLNRRQKSAKALVRGVGGTPPPPPAPAPIPPNPTPPTPVPIPPPVPGSVSMSVVRVSAAWAARLFLEVGSGEARGEAATEARSDLGGGGEEGGLGQRWREGRREGGGGAW